MTAIMMAQMGTAALTAAKLETTITVGSDDYLDVGTEDTYFVFGYNDALDAIVNVNAFGSIANDTYIDGSSTSRTISGCMWSEPTGGAAPTIDDNLYFGLVGISIPDTDSTFSEIEYNGVIYTRASVDTYTANQGGVATYWQWDNVSPNPPTSGVREFILRL